MRAPNRVVKKYLSPRCLCEVLRQAPRTLVLAVPLLALSTGACGYRFTTADRPLGITLASVRNASDEPGLAPLLSDALDRVAGLRPGVGRPLEVAVTRFDEKVAAIDSDGRVLRQAVSLVLSWKLGGDGGGEERNGQESVSRSYPAREDAAGVAWARQAALRQLAEDAARALGDRLAELP